MGYFRLGLCCILLTALVGCSFPSREEKNATATSLPVIPIFQTEAIGPLETLVTPELMEVTVFFTDSNRFATGIPPFETGVPRLVQAGPGLPEAVLNEFFRGPTEEEQAFGLESITSGFTGFSALVIEDGIARVYLNGPCRSNGATYTIAQPVIANLSQFEQIHTVKIYDAEGTTENPDGPGNSIPFCLEP